MHNLTYLIIITIFFASCTPKTTKQLQDNSNIDQFSSSTLLPPSKVTASDGVYPSHVLVYWDAVPNADGYRVFRMEKDRPNTNTEITKAQQKSSWLSDYTAKIGEKYLYTIQATAKGINSPSSPQDMGYLKDRERLAQNEPTEEMVLATPNTPNFSITLEKAVFGAGGSIKVNYELPEAIPYISQLRFYLSEDENFDWKDTFISDMQPRSFNPDAILEGSIQVQLPNDFTGNTYFLAVYSVDGTVTASSVAGEEIVIK